LDEKLVYIFKLNYVFYFWLEFIHFLDNVDKFIYRSFNTFSMVMKRYLLPILVLPVIMGACKTTKESDSSLTLEEYRKLGVPDYDTIWGLGDYADAFNVLNTLKLEQPFALPTRDSKKSGALFNRMINLENLSFLQDETLPLYQKAHVIKLYLSVQNDFIDFYTNILMKKQYYNRELVDIYIFGLRVTQKMLDLAHQINESDDPGDVMIQSGYKSIQDIYMMSLTECLRIQQQPSEYPEKALELLTDSLSSSVRRNKVWFDEDDSEKIRQAMLTVIDSTSSRKIINDYRDLIEIL